MAQDNVDVIESAFAAFRKGDIEALIGFFAESARIVVPDSVPWGGTYEGPEGMRTMLAKFLEHFREFKSTPEKVLGADDNHVVVVARDSGRTKSANRVEVMVTWLFQLRDGQIVSADVFVDTAVLREALG